MSKTRSLAVLLAAGFFINFGATYSTNRANAQSDDALHIDIPVKLEKANWVNADLLPGVKVNTNAMARVTELEQEGFTLIYE